MKLWATHAQNTWHASMTPSPSPQIGYTLQVCSTHCSIAISYFVTHFISFHVYIHYTNNSTNYEILTLDNVGDDKVRKCAKLPACLVMFHEKFEDQVSSTRGYLTFKLLVQHHQTHWQLCTLSHSSTNHHHLTLSSLTSTVSILNTL